MRIYRTFTDVEESYFRDHPEEIDDYVSILFEEYAKGNNSFQTIAAKMKAAGFPLTSRGKSITHRTVEIILKNPFYIGMMNSKGQLHPHKYQTLISEQLFYTVQKVIANHHKAPVQYAGKPILLRGLISCKNCNSSVCGDIKKGKYVYYSCHNSKRICTKKWVKEEVLLKELFGYFDQIELTDDQINEIAEHIEENLSLIGVRGLPASVLSVVKNLQRRFGALHV